MRCKICDKSTSAPTIYNGVDEHIWKHNDPMKNDLCTGCNYSIGQSLMEFGLDEEHGFNRLRGKDLTDRRIHDTINYTILKDTKSNL